MARFARDRSGAAHMDDMEAIARAYNAVRRTGVLDYPAGRPLSKPIAADILRYPSARRALRRDG